MRGIVHHNCLTRAAGWNRLFRLLLLVVCACTLPAKAQINTTNTILLGRSALYHDDYAKAIEYFTSALDAKPYLAEAYYYRGYARFSIKEYDNALNDLNQAIAFNPFRVEYYQLRGLCRIHTTDYQGAIDDYTHALVEVPNDQGVLYNRVLCRLELKDYSTASSELDDIIRRWPKFSRAYLVKAQTCLALQDTLQGLHWIDSLFTFSRREPAAWRFKGSYALEHEDYPLADSCYTQAIRFDALNADYYLERAQVRHALSRYNLALADYDKVIELIPQHFVAHYNRGLIRSTVGDDNRAIEDFDFVIDAEPDNTLAIYNRAELRKRVGDLRGAIADYSSLIKEYPNFLYGYAQRAECYRSIGRFAQAQRDESYVRRADYDLLFGKRRTQSLKKVRRRSEKALEQYDQLVVEDKDTTNVFVGGIAGPAPQEKPELPADEPLPQEQNESPSAPQATLSSEES